MCDEATSALDSTTEAEILTALRFLANNRTAVFIAHRLTTAMQCDEACPFSHNFFLLFNHPKFSLIFLIFQIIVLEKGKVVEQGAHEALLSNGGRYAQLWSQQNNTVDDLDAAIKLEA